MNKKERRDYRKPEDWTRVKVWWAARNKWSDVVHVAASYGGGRMTRCGLRIWQGGKQWKVYEFTRTGSPITPTCGVCIRLRKQDIEQQWSASFGEKYE